jgi:hypothetical protein
MYWDKYFSLSNNSNSAKTAVDFKSILSALVHGYLTTYHMQIFASEYAALALCRQIIWMAFANLSLLLPFVPVIFLPKDIVLEFGNFSCSTKEKKKNCTLYQNVTTPFPSTVIYFAVELHISSRIRTSNLPMLGGNVYRWH